MLSSLLTQLQTQLLSKRFFVAGLLPVLLFLFANGWMLYRHCKAFHDWAGKIDTLKDQAVLSSMLVITLLAVAYLFSALNASLLEWLEGKSGISRLTGPWLYWHQHSKLTGIEREYNKTGLNVSQIQNALKKKADGGQIDWIQKLRDARIIGVATNTCAPKWRKTEDGHKAFNVLWKARLGLKIDYDELNVAIDALVKLLTQNSANLKDRASTRLDQAHKDFENAIYYARDRNQFDRIRLYNQRQFTYPGSFESSEDTPQEASPHNVLALTTMGNIGRTMRSYAITRYNLDLEIFWSRLQSSIQSNQSNKDYFAVLQDVKVQVDCLVALVWLFALFSVIWVPVMLCQKSFWDFLFAGMAGLLSLGLYSLACKTYSVFADIMRSAVDLFHFKLLDDLHVRLPVWREEEKLVWERMGNVTGYARKESIRYTHGK